MKKVLLTGAGAKSFIGRRLKEQMGEEYHLFTPSHAQLELMDEQAVLRYIDVNRIEAIIHAAVHVPMFNGKDEYLNDMKMFMNIEKASHMVDRVVYFGSGAEYDKRFDIVQAKEEEIGRTIPTSEYGLAKYTMNLIARQSKNMYNLRCFSVFGEYELWQYRFLSNICCKALFNLPLTIRQDCAFDFVYIDDFPQAVGFCLEGTPKFKDYNLCSGQRTMLTQAVEMIQEISGTTGEIVLLSEGLNLEYTGNNTRLVTEAKAKFKPLYTALEKLYKYYYENKGLVDYNILKDIK